MAELAKNRATLKTNSRDASRINIRYAPNGDDIKTDRPQGTEVRVIAKSATDTNGYIWYKITYIDGAVSELGWVREDVIDIASPDWNTQVKPKEDIVATDKNTLLFFDTQERTVRVFTAKETLHLNIYDKKSSKTQLHQVKAICLPDIVCAPDGSKTPWQSYVAEQDRLLYTARFVPLKQSELIVSHAVTGKVFNRAAGFGSKGIAYQEGLQ